MPKPKPLKPTDVLKLESCPDDALRRCAFNKLPKAVKPKRKTRK